MLPHAELKQIRGWCSEIKTTYLYNLVKHLQPTLCVEIGVFEGASYIPIGLALKENKRGLIYGIDSWDDKESVKGLRKEDKEWWEKVDHHDSYIKFIDNIVKFEIPANQYNFIVAKSDDVLDNFLRPNIDILHIDGNHSEEQSYRDVINWLPKVREGGYIIFDDLYWGETGYRPTKNAVIYLLKNCKFVDIVGECLVVKK